MEINMEHHAVKNVWDYIYNYYITINPPLPAHPPMLFLFKNQEKGQVTTEATAYSKKLIMKIGWQGALIIQAYT